uniref:aspartate carbamoyltransferase n=1 Tax=viral metagenome TaxID=1070528 RepID=A0A6C0KK75_9ZZZZ
MTNSKKIQTLFHLSQLIAKQQYVPKYAQGKVLVEAFFEPSTRTALSFECAMKKLGGEVITFHQQGSSKIKGESDMDTIMTLSHYGDALILRHPDHDLYEQVVNNIHIPVINGGNGANLHPTQALLDLYTLYKRFGDDFQYKKILFVGDIKQSRTIHSFVHLLELYPKTQIYFHPYLNCEPEYTYINHISRIHNQDETKMIVYGNDIDYGNYDVVYLTRYQKERHVDSASTTMVMSSYRFTYENANDMHENAIIMHPFPRNQELDTMVDSTPQAYYFQQSKYGVELRMAILETLFKESQQKHTVNTISFPKTKQIMETTMFYCNAINIGTFIHNRNAIHVCFMLFIYMCTHLFLHYT